MHTLSFSQKQLIADLDKVCDQLGAEYKALCKLAVTAAAPQVINELAGLLVSLY